jgi:uncharacterized flavoprotein (TIGR03862 family)
MKKQIAIIGAGPSAFLLAAFLDPLRFEVTIYEQHKAPGRKFLVAGKGGFNLSHAEEMSTFVKRYTPDDFLAKALLEFTNDDLRQWLATIDIATYVGSSKRIYPVKGIKPIEVLQKILALLEGQGVHMTYQHEWVGWGVENNLLLMDHTSGSIKTIKADYTVFALGGGSWKVTGSTGLWLPYFSEKGIQTKPFQAANCAYGVNWPEAFRKEYGGQPLKNIEISCGDQQQSGEVVLTDFGLEGSAIYALSPVIQKQLEQYDSAKITIDLKPVFTAAAVFEKLKAAKERNISAALSKVLKLSKAQIALLKNALSKEDFTDLAALSKHIKQLTIQLHTAAPVDEAISTSGGIALDELSPNFELKKLPTIFCIGEMSDWNAPTGGYLLQACFSMGVYLARYLNRRG